MTINEIKTASDHIGKAIDALNEIQGQLIHAIHYSGWDEVPVDVLESLADDIDDAISRLEIIDDTLEPIAADIENLAEGGSL